MISMLGLGYGYCGIPGVNFLFGKNALFSDLDQFSQF
jgi:hypothetical protein